MRFLNLNSLYQEINIITLCVIFIPLTIVCLFYFIDKINDVTKRCAISAFLSIIILLLIIMVEVMRQALMIKDQSFENYVNLNKINVTCYALFIPLWLYFFLHAVRSIKNATQRFYWTIAIFVLPVISIPIYFLRVMRPSRKA